MKVSVGPNPQSRSSSQGSLVGSLWWPAAVLEILLIRVISLVTQSSTLGLELNLLNEDKNAYNDDEFRYGGNYVDDPLDAYEDHKEGDHDLDQEISDFPPRLDSLSDD